jgi:hypothetical protein
MKETTPTPILFTDNGQVLRYAWPGGYPVFYIANDCDALCPTCVQENLELCKDPDDCEFFVTGHAVNWESDSLCCDHCSKTIESAYGEAS